MVSCIPQKVCPQVSWHDLSVGTRFEKQNRFRDIGRGVVSGIDWSEDLSTRGEQKSVSLEESCRSRHVTRL